MCEAEKMDIRDHRLHKFWPGMHWSRPAHFADRAVFPGDRIFFAKSSRRLHGWFMGARLYQKHLDSFVKKKGMTVRTKAAVLTSVTLLMGLGFMMMGRVPVGRIILAVVWVCHVTYFLFGVRTIRAPGNT